MIKRNIAIVLANTGHARFLRRDHDSGDFHRWLAIEDGPSGRTADDERLRQRRVHAFTDVIATHLREMAAAHPLQGVVVVAPARMLASLKASAATACPVLASAAKDLIKVEDHELGHLLHTELLQAESQLRAPA